MMALPDRMADEAYLQPTRYCDAGHDLIRAMVRSVDGDALEPRTRAVRLFRLVRDDVRYFFGPWAVPASETLALREGTCSNKNNLLIALLRAAHIPAAYGVLRVNAQEYFGNLTPEHFKPRGSANSTHLYAAAFLDGRWIKVDCSTDSEVASKTSHFCRQTQLLDWDGTTDAMDALEPSHVHADLGLLASADHLLDKAPQNATPQLFSTLNDYVRFIRSSPPFPSAAALQAAYFARR